MCFNYYKEEITNEFIAKLVSLYYDTLNKVQIYFLDDSNIYYTLDKQGINKIVEDSGVLNRRNNIIDEEKKELYNSVGDFLKQEITLTKSDITTILNCLFTSAQYFMNKELYNMEIYDLEDESFILYIQTKTINNKVITIRTIIDLNDISREYQVVEIGIGDYKEPVARFYLDLYSI